MKPNRAKFWNDQARKLGKHLPFPVEMEKDITPEYRVITPDDEIISIQEYMKTDDYNKQLERVVNAFMTDEKEKELLALFEPKKSKRKKK